jgi:hypothetical protein
MSVIVNSAILRELTETNTLLFNKKAQKIGGCYNYFTSPALSIKVFKPKIVFCDGKCVVFQFDKFDQSTLFTLVKYTNSVCVNQLKRQYPISSEKTLYDLFSEQDNTFTLRCYLPNFKGKYFIDYYEDDAEVRFKVPHSNIVLDEVTIYIRNIWENLDKLGFNLEVKQIRN